HHPENSQSDQLDDQDSCEPHPPPEPPEADQRSNPAPKHHEHGELSDRPESDQARIANPERRASIDVLVRDREPDERRNPHDPGADVPARECCPGHTGKTSSPSGAFGATSHKWGGPRAIRLPSASPAREFCAAVRSREG